MKQSRAAALQANAAQETSQKVALILENQQRIEEKLDRILEMLNDRKDAKGKKGGDE